MVKILKRNQLIILVIALMLVTAGYLNYNTNNNETIQTNANEIEIAGIGDATLVSSNNIVEENENTVENTIKEEAQNTNNVLNQNTAVNVNSKTNQDNYFVTTRLERDKMYSQTIENYQKMLDSSNTDQTSKQIATEEIKKATNIKNAIMISENLIKTKGIEDVVILVNDISINVIIKAETIPQEQIAQIQNIISREMKAEITNIHISNK